MKRAIVFAVSVQVWTGCVALPEEAMDELLLDGAVPSELVLDGGSSRPPVGQPYQGPPCATDPAGGSGGQAAWSGGDAAVEWPGDGDGDGDTAGSGGGGGSEPPTMDGGDMMLPAQPRPERAGDVLITEIMFDPKGRTDAQGEWIELVSASDEALSLEGCALDDGASAARKLEPFVLEAGAYMTIGRGAEAGFIPDLAVALALTNSSDTVALVCDGVEIDRVSYDGTFPLRTGASLSLDPAFMAPLENDDPASWCQGVDDYGGDLGTPGAPNPSCSPSDAGAL